MNLDLNTVWFVLIGVLFTGYAVLDGFDLGVGSLHLFAKGDDERRLMMNAIGPVWDGNEVWLVTGGGALFAAFPPVYATVFSGFYLALMLLLCALIFRAVSIEFRSKLPMAWWRSMWDWGFCLGSLLSALLIGVALGNLAWGVPLDANGDFVGSFVDLLHPYAVLMGITTVALFMMHGAIYVALKTEGALHEKVKRDWIRNGIVFFVLCYAAATMATLLYVPHMAHPIKSKPAFFFLPLFTMLAIADIPREIHLGREFRAFVASSAAIAGLLALFGVGVYPNMVISRPNPEFSLTIHNAASSSKTLGIMLAIAAIGVPLVLAYTVSIYWVFRGKVKLTPHSY